MYACVCVYVHVWMVYVLYAYVHGMCMSMCVPCAYSVCICLHLCALKHTQACEGQRITYRILVYSFYPVGPGNQTRVVRVGDRYLTGKPSTTVS